MEKKEHITLQLQKLINLYDMNIHTLSKYLALSPEQIEAFMYGDIDVLPQNSLTRREIFNKIAFLYASVTEDKDLKLSSFLKVLTIYHGLTTQAIAKIAGVTAADVEKLLSYPTLPVADEVKYKVAVTVMALRFFLKECEGL